MAIASTPVTAEHPEAKALRISTIPSAVVGRIGPRLEPIRATGWAWNGPTMITARTLTTNTAAGSMRSFADSAIPNMFTAVSTARPIRPTARRWWASAGKHAAEAGRAGGKADRHGEDVVDEQRRRGEQRRDPAEVELRDGVRAAALGVRRDHLRVGDHEQRQHPGDHERQRQREAQRTRSRRDEHDDHRLGPVGDARERIEAERGEPASDAELVSLVGVLSSAAMARQRDAALRGPPRWTDAGCPDVLAFRFFRVSGRVAQRRSGVAADHCDSATRWTRRAPVRGPGAAGAGVRGPRGSDAISGRRTWRSRKGPPHRSHCRGRDTEGGETIDALPAYTCAAADDLDDRRAAARRAACAPRIRIRAAAL